MVNVSSKNVLEKTDVPVASGYHRDGSLVGAGILYPLPLLRSGTLAGTCVGLVHATVASVNSHSVVHQFCCV